MSLVEEGEKMGVYDGGSLGLVSRGLETPASAASGSHSYQMVTFACRFLWCGIY